MISTETFTKMLTTNGTVVVVLLCIVTTAMSASISTESLTASINEVQKRFAAVPIDKRIVDSNIGSSNSNDQKSDASESLEASKPQLASVSDDIERPTSKAKEKHRNDKMLDFYRYYAPAATPTAAAPSYSFPYYPYYNPYYQQPYMSAFYSPYYSPIVESAQATDEYDEEYPESNDVDGNGVMGAGETDEDGSRANKRRPGTGKNSPIFYIRLPPTPYSKYSHFCCSFFFWIDRPLKILCFFSLNSVCTRNGLYIAATNNSTAHTAISNQSIYQFAHHIFEQCKTNGSVPMDSTVAVEFRKSTISIVFTTTTAKTVSSKAITNCWCHNNTHTRLQNHPSRFVFVQWPSRWHLFNATTTTISKSICSISNSKSISFDCRLFSTGTIQSILTVTIHI